MQNQENDHISKDGNHKSENSVKQFSIQCQTIGILLLSLLTPNNLVYHRCQTICRSMDNPKFEYYYYEIDLSLTINDDDDDVMMSMILYIIFYIFFVVSNL